MAANREDRVSGFLADVRAVLERHAVEVDVLHVDAEGDVRVAYRAPDLAPGALRGLNNALVGTYGGAVWGAAIAEDRGNPACWSPGTLYVRGWTPDRDDEVTWHVRPDWILASIEASPPAGDGRVEASDVSVDVEGLGERVNQTVALTVGDVVYVSRGESK